MKIHSIAVHEEVVSEAAHKGAKWLRSKYAEWWLAGISAAESMFAPILIDPFLVALIFARRQRWIRYTLISVVFSVIGGLGGYVLGAIFFDTIGTQLVSAFGLTESFNSVAQNLDKNGFVFVLIGALTPVPYKVVALASGVLQVNLMTFLVASIFGRFFRLGLVGFAAYMVGPHALPVIQRHLHLFAAIIGLLLVGYIIYMMV